jgi:hypothetical protein
MRFLLRFFSLVCLAVATVVGTIDSIQSVAASGVVITPLADAWKSLSPSSFDKLQSTISLYDGVRFYGVALQWLMSQPAFAVFLAISLLTWMVAYRRAPAAGRFAV